jgi:hypothetical protein
MQDPVATVKPPFSQSYPHSGSGPVQVAFPQAPGLTLTRVQPAIAGHSAMQPGTPLDVDALLVLVEVAPLEALPPPPWAVPPPVACPPSQPPVPAAASGSSIVTPGRQ